MHRYAVFGLSIASEIALPELRSGPNGVPDLTIRLAAIADPETRPGHHQTGDAALLVVPGIARFSIVAGSEMVVEPAPEAAPRDVRLFVLGSAMGAVLHARGLLPLHANAVGVGAGCSGGAIALLGHSGAGKSSLARWFHDRGHPVLSDDVCVVGPDGLVAPGIPRLRLWRDALEASGRRADDYAASYAGADKFDVPLAGAGAGPLPLRAAYLLDRGDAATITPLSGARAVEALVANTYRGSFVRSGAPAVAHLATCVALARWVPIFIFTRRWGADGFDEDAAALVAHAEALAPWPAP